MALGFGFNKQKVLATAEKYVQQGKLTNAIAEYEKIIEKEPKDLTVLNTVGDLYSRAGDASKASEYYTRVGDSYASQGFTLRAIAMYKKVTKLDPNSISMVQKLAELYTQQGLLNDARQQYLILADSALKKNDYDSAARIFEKMLEGDTDNVGIQAKLADIYVKLGKKDKARELLFRLATSLSERKSTDAAVEALNRLLAMDPTNTEALLLRGRIALDAGDTAGGIKFLERVPTIDSLPQGLHSLLRAYIKTEKYEEAEPMARKLLTVHNDNSGIREYATALVTSGRGEIALRIYDEFSSTLLAGDGAEVILSLQPLVGQLKDHPASLESLRNIFLKAGASSSVPEINELLAHAYVQSGELEKSRDLYKELADLEPGNPLHMQNYRQVMARLGQDSAARPTEPDQGEQAFFLEELAEQTGPSLQQSYAPAISDSINSALTESELYESYGKPQQAIQLLESALNKAPQDARLNQRLASIYLRSGRSEDAARCYHILFQVFFKAGKSEEAKQYADYAARCGVPVSEIDTSPVEAAPAPEPPQVVTHTQPEPEPVSKPQVHEVAADVPAFEITPPEHAEAGEAHEIDLSAEWEAAVSEEVPVEAHPAEVHLPPPPPAPFAETKLPEPLEAKLPEPEETPVAAEAPHPSVISDLLEETKFYISQSMLDEARNALGRLHELSPDNAEIDALEQQIEAAATIAASAPEPVAAPPEQAPQDVSAGAGGFDDRMIENLLSQKDDAGFEAPPPPAETIAAQAAPITEFELEELPIEPEHIPGIVHDSRPVERMPAVPEPPAVPPPAAKKPAAKKPEAKPELKPEPPKPAPTPPKVKQEPPKPTVAAKSVIEPLGDLASMEEEPESEREPIVLEPEPQPELARAAASHRDNVLSDFVLDLENSLGNDFLAGGNGGAPPAFFPGPGTSSPSVPTMPAPSMPSHAAAASISQPQVSGTAAAVATAPVIETAPPETEDVASPLSELFAEFKEEVEEGSSDSEDPETHYNMGVAFKEMGLLDEAIGELQKVCSAIERGKPFPQIIQAYTWLAHCFVEKGIPEAGIKWYEKALQVPGDQETRTAVEYELACACEAAGDRNSALKHFLEVYGSNIDYRDVSDRIKALKA